MDRRIKYTKRVLNESLVNFLGKKEITRITVTELCKDADVNRSTYYAHFLDPYDQLAKLKSDLLSELVDYIVRIDTSGLQPEEIRYVVIKTLVEYVDSKKNIFRILLAKSGDRNMQEEILDILGRKAFRKELETGRTEEEAQQLLMYAVNGCFGLFFNWLMSDDTDAEKTAKRMAEYTGYLLKI